MFGLINYSQKVEIKKLISALRRYVYNILFSDCFINSDLH